MPITDTTNFTTITSADTRVLYTAADGVRNVVREELGDYEIHQFINWLATHDPEFRQKFIAFRTAKRMGVVK